VTPAGLQIAAPRVGMTEDFSTPIEPGGGLETSRLPRRSIEIFVDVTRTHFLI